MVAVCYILPCTVHPVFDKSSEDREVIFGTDKARYVFELQRIYKYTLDSL